MGNFRLIGGDIRLPAESVVNETVAAATKIDADKLQHLYKAGTSFGLAIGATPAAVERIVFVASGAATIRGFHALLNDTGTNTDVDFDLKVNGASVLSSVVTLTDADGDRSVSDGALSSAALVAGDVVSIELAVTTTTGAQGPFAWVEIEENAA
ncbi:hypothetical protein CA54_16810 [Symmachiella macrocystis]|uniref:Uncharacterized protein n=2 Tax=Symmachiella macrocystis TaxID=2527985 RepID=A0A5C6BLG5_9PLAN|nr:hypothetical protein CA54_16810 [Symmachiella macrocystis]